MIIFSSLIKYFHQPLRQITEPMIFNRIKKFYRYLLGKKSEIKHLDYKDALLAKVIVDIHRKRTSSEFIHLPLFSIIPVHPINRKNSILDTEKRMEKLQYYKDELTRKRNLSRDTLAEYLPSVSSIKVVKNETGFYISYEGNGRLTAMQRVFTPEENIYIEVELYHFKNPKKIIRRLNRVRRVNGLI